MPEPTRYTLDAGTQGSTLDAYTALEWLLVDMRSANTIAAMLQAAKDAMEQERKEDDDETATNLA